MEEERDTAEKPDKRKQILEALYQCLHLPIRLLDETGAVLEQPGGSPEFCRCFHDCVGEKCTVGLCREWGMPPGREDGYFPPTPCQLERVVIPLTAGARLYGVLEAGPFLCGRTAQDAIDSLLLRYPDIPAAKIPALYDALRGLETVFEEKKHHLCLLLSHVFEGLGRPGREAPPETETERPLPALVSPIETDGRNPDMIQRAMQYIAAHFASDLTLEEVAEQVHLSPAYFSSVFKQGSGTSFKEYLNLVRIEESKRLLLSTDQPLIDIAMASGFGDQSYFSKVFKKYTGLTPRQFRS